MNPMHVAAGTARNTTRELTVGGLVRLSTTDYPDCLSAVVFCQGCAWRCDYCHNPHLQSAHASTPMRWEAVRAFLQTRRALLDAVVFSGGEPTQQPGLLHAMREARAMGFKIGLHTAGSHPRRLAQVLPLLDWVGMDVKAPFSRYAEITGVERSGERARSSVRLILASGVDYEFRTTVHGRQLTRKDVMALAAELTALGARRYALQEFRAEGCLSPELRQSALERQFDETLAGSLEPQFDEFRVRRA